MRARRKLLRLSPFDAQGVTTHNPEPELLSQSNPHNVDGEFWCGRTSASMVWNYYRYVSGRTGELIKNRYDAPPYQLVYVDQKPAALNERGECAPDEVFDRLSAEQGKPWRKIDLLPAGKRGKVDLEEVLRELLDNLDNNNPAFFSSGISKSEKYCSHFVVISGYEYGDDGALWLQIHDPATNHSVLRLLLHIPPDAGVEAYRHFLKIDQAGSFAKVPNAPRPFGSIYRVKAEALLTPNPLLSASVFAEHCKIHPPPTPNLVCDNSFRPFFQVYVTSLATEESDFVITDLALSWPIEPPREKAPAAKPGDAPAPAEPPVDWTSWVDLGAGTGTGGAAGPYPIGEDLTWHGGLHVRKGSSAGDRLFSIGVGEVVLARFPKEKAEGAPATWARAEEAPSSGFVLVRHRFDREMRDLAPPAASPDLASTTPPKAGDPIEFHSLVMHTGPISRYVEDDPEQGVPVANALSPRWLRKFLPAKLPAPRTWLPGATKVTLAAFDSPESAAAGKFSALRRDFDVLHSDRPFKAKPLSVGDAPTELLDVGGAPAMAVPNPGYSNRLLGLSALQPFALEGDAALGYWNPLTEQLVAAPKIVAPKSTLVVLTEDSEGVEVLHTEAGQSWVRVRALETPGFKVHDAKGAQVETGVLVVTAEEVGLSFEQDGVLTPLKTLSRTDARLLFQGSSAGEPILRPVLWPLVRATKDRVTGWNAQLTKGEIPRADLRDLVFYNPLTEEIIEGGGGAEPNRPVALSIDATQAKGHLRPTVTKVMEVGNQSYLQVEGITPCLEVDPAGVRHDPAEVVFFDRSSPTVKLFVDAQGEAGARALGSHFATLKNVLGDSTTLAFRVASRDSVDGVEQLWLDVVSCAKVPSATVDAWNAQLRGQRGKALDACRRRLRAGLSALYGVSLAPKSGWGLDASGRIVQTPGTGPEAPLVDDIVVDKGQGALHSLGTDSPWQLKLDGPIHPIGLIHDKTGKATGAMFEAALTVPPGSSVDNAADRERVKGENEALWQKVVGSLSQGELLSLADAPEKVMREYIAHFDPEGTFAHVEIFSEKNLIASVEGTDGKVVPIPKTPFFILRDDDATDTFTPDFVKNTRAALRQGAMAARLEEKSLARADAEGGVIKPSEWLAFNRDNHRMLSFFITGHGSEWHPDHEKILDDGKRRGAHLTEAQEEKTRATIKRLAFLDSIEPSYKTYLFYHPLRFVEWLTTGVDIDVKGAKSPTVQIGPVGEAMVDAKTPRPLFFRYRPTVGDTLWTKRLRVKLGGDLRTKNPELEVEVTRGRIHRLSVVNPDLDCRVSTAEDVRLALHYPVTIRPFGGGYVLADGGRQDHETTLGVVTYEVSTNYNLERPTTIEGTLQGSGFAIRDVRAPAGAKATFQKNGTSFSVSFPARTAKQKAEAFRGPQAERVLVDVVGREGKVGQSVQLSVKASGGDIGSASALGPKLETRVIVASTKKGGTPNTSGEDVAELQLYLSQILASDGLPCLANPEAGALALLGIYGPRLAAGIWRFLYSFANDPTEPLGVETVQVTDPSGKPLKQAAPHAAEVTLAQLRTPVPESMKARCGEGTAEFPVIDGALATAIARRFQPPHVLPTLALDVRVADGGRARDAASAFGGLLATPPGDVQATAALGGMGVFCKSAILPGERIEITGTAGAMSTLKGSLDVVLEVPGGSAYRLVGAAARKLTASAASFTATLEWSGTYSVKEADNTLVVKAKNGAILGSIVLGGCRDLSGVERDGVAKRDALVVERWLSVVTPPIRPPMLSPGPPYFPPPAGKGRPALPVDGKWGSLHRAALKKLATDYSTSNFEDTVAKLRKLHATSG